MDPEGSMYFLICLVISIIVCLYIAQISVDEDYDDYEIGISSNLISAFLVFIANFGMLTYYIVPKFDILWRCIYMALFVFCGIFIPYCIAVAENQKLSLVKKIVQPLISVLNYSVTLVIKLPISLIFRAFKLSAKTQITQEDVMELVEDASDEIIDDDRKEMIENIFELDNIYVSEIMKHRTEVLAISEEETCQFAVEKMQERGFSRIPVYKNSIDNIIGVVYAKDLLAIMMREDKKDLSVKNVARKAMFVPQSCSANDLLVQFKLKRMQMAIVVDEYGGTSGIVTMEDILEEIVGNIQDEYDDEDEEFEKVNDTTYIFKASYNIYDAMDLFDIDIQQQDPECDFDTVGGMIINILTRIPEQGENAVVEYSGVIFTVLEVVDRKITKVKAEKIITQTEE